jgi:hypothetical protein
MTIGKQSAKENILILVAHIVMVVEHELDKGKECIQNFGRKALYRPRTR